MAYQTMRGFYDILPEKSEAWLKMESLIRTMCTLYDYDEIRTPIVEDTKVFKRENDSSDMVNKEMYSFVMGKDNYTLRPEGTAGVIRSFVEHKFYGSMELPAKLYYIGPMFRHERPQKGRQRQFHQFGIENIGLMSPLADAECIALGYSILKAFGLKSIKVLINTLGDDESRANYRSALKEHFAASLDELCDDCKRRYEQNPLRILDCKVDHDKKSVQTAPKLLDYLNESSRAYFGQVLKMLETLGIPYEIDDKLVRGLDYYTHTVFEVVSLHEDSGSQSTIFGGGRYDHLVEYFGGPSLSGVGFAIGLERLMMLIEAEGQQLTEEKSLDVYVMSLGDCQAKALEIATILRSNGYKCEANLQARSMKSQFKSVDRKKAKYMIVAGEDEIAKDCYTIKDLATKQEYPTTLANMVEVLDGLIEGEEI
ncbi:MAG: histidine--tRNA ligase [Erysipelotrichaceae bacterium]|nr:histidine--tRNA ligase [Erysipelotrichaceae bacterium]